MAFLVFVTCLAGIVLLGWVVSRITGARTQYVETFSLQAGERVLWEDFAADAYPTHTRRALIVSYRRSRRSAVRVTTLRILSGAKALFGSNHVLQHVLYPSDRSFPDAANAIGGGLLTIGYQSLVFERASLSRHSSEQPPFAELTLTPRLSSSLNLDRFRIYSDHLEALPLPD